MQRDLRASGKTPRRTPAFLVTGIDPVPTAATAMGLAWDLPRPVTLTHVLHPEDGTPTRTVSDLGGVVEHQEIELEHACVHCAIREEVVPTLARLAADGRWASIVAVLPASADARQVCRLVGRSPDVAPALRIAGVLAALGGDDLEFDLTGDDLLADRLLGIVDDDRRGVAEVLAGLIEYADLISVAAPEGPDGETALPGGLAMVRALARPGAMVVTDWPGFDGAQLVEGIHAHDCSEEWVAEVRHQPLPEPGEGTWQLELTSERPLHPGRMLERIEDLGSGTFRSRGCFWLPTRPGLAVRVGRRRRTALDRARLALEAARAAADADRRDRAARPRRPA